MIKTICISLLLLACSTIKAPAQFKLKEPAVSFGKIDSVCFAISQRPVTNKEYIIYLMWLDRVYSPNYPEIVYNSLPGLHRDTLSRLFSLNNKHLLDNMDSIYKYSDPYIKEYMFNPAYIDYPVIGVKWQDANNYCKWLSDRYNEVMLIKKGETGFQPTATENDFFYTELLLMSLWQGQTRTGKQIYLRDNVFVPTFRLPTKQELNFAKNMSDVSIEFKAYPLTKSNVLYQWYKLYFSEVTDNSFLLDGYPHIYYGPFLFTKNNTTFKKPSLKELNVDINNKNNSADLIEIYKQNGQNRINVDSLFQNYNCCRNVMQAPYIMIGEDAGKPIIVNSYKDLEGSKNSTSEFTFFRFACTVKESIKK